MKKSLYYFVLTVGIMIAADGLQAQNINYLHRVKPAAENNYHTFASHRTYVEGTDRRGVMGGVPYKEGFVIQYNSGKSGGREYGYVEYRLGRRYSKLQFILGTVTGKNPTNAGVLVVKGDGQNLLDRVVKAQAVPTTVSLDVTGIDVLRFEMVKGEVDFGIAEPTLWLKGQTPRATAYTSTVKGDKAVRLVADLRPYYQDTYHKCISSKDGDEHEVKLSGKTYTSGITMNAYVRIVGNGRSATLFNLDGKFKTFTMTAGIKDRDAGVSADGWVTVLADGKAIYEHEFKEGNLYEQVRLDVEGCRQLSIESEQAQGSSTLVAVDMTVWPAGQEPTAEKQTGSGASSLKKLPDVCKLISNIPPYGLTGSSNMEQNLFDGKSTHVTFSMGGTKFYEGFILQSTTHILNDNTRARVHFNLDGEFDYISFTSGWVSKCGVLKNDTLRIYADDEIVFNMPLIATNPNQHYTVPINKCRKLTFEKRGIVSMDHPAFGVADIVAYRGKPVENNLFPHPTPDLPDEQELCSLGKPYIYHSIFGVNLDSEKATSLKYRFLDGSTKKQYFELGDNRIYSGFALRTSVHFDMEAGTNGGAGAGAAVVAAGMGASLMIGTVGGATVSAVCPFGALLMLAAGGTAHESACAAFNTYGAYDELTFTVSSYTPAFDKYQREVLKIGGDGQVLQEYQISSNMQSTTFTLPIKRCEQLMFWLECGESSSGIYLFHDIMLRKTGNARSSVSGGVAGVGSHAGAVADAEPYSLPVETLQRHFVEWERPAGMCNVKAIDDYLVHCGELKRKIELFLGMPNKTVAQENRILSYKPIEHSTFDHMVDVGARTNYRTAAVYVTASDGHNYRSVSLETDRGDVDFRVHRERNQIIMRAARMALADIVTLKIEQASANLSLPELGFAAVRYGKIIKTAASVIDMYKEQLETLIADKEAENQRIDALLRAAITLDGVPSKTNAVFVR